MTTATSRAAPARCALCVVLMAAGPAGCGAAQQGDAASPSTTTASATATRNTQALASVFPTVDDFALTEMDDQEWAMVSIGGHDMLEWTDDAGHTCWYCVSGKGDVIVASLDRDSGTKDLQELAPLVF